MVKQNKRLGAKLVKKDIADVEPPTLVFRIRIKTEGSKKLFTIKIFIGEGEVVTFNCDTEMTRAELIQTGFLLAIMMEPRTVYDGAKWLANMPNPF